ncbi:hypothetical protein GCM10009744_11390 [Kribbella alba]|uniref:Dynamin family protein n=1 Tax=Kribbella alba TaxID=190197 RepID=A0ABN2F0Y9_9ACTN
MADTRSAAGEGSERSDERRVPAQDQPAQELAKLIGDSDAKGKGFWRRLRKSKTADPSTTSAAPSTTSAEPAAKSSEPAEEAAEGKQTESVETTAAATPAEAAPADGDKVASEDRKSADDESVAAADKQAESKTTDGEGELGKAEASKSTDVGPSAAESGGAGDETTQAPTAEADAGTAETADEPGSEESSADGSVADDAAEVEAQGNDGDVQVEAQGNDVESEGEQPGGVEAVAAEAVADQAAPGEEPAAAETPESADESAGEPTAEPVQEHRPTVGVVYEPDESTDAFPMEYGDIIIGLPKPPDPDKRTKRAPETASTTDPANDPESAADRGESSVSAEPEPEPPADAEHAASEHGDSEHAGSEHDVFEHPAEAEATAEAEHAPETSAQSEAGELSEPVTDQGVEAAGDVPADPAAEDSVDPEDDQPTDAATEGANQPVADQSGESTGDGPADTVAEDPAEPQAEEDAEPVGDAPATEEAGEAAELVAGEAGTAADEGAEPAADEAQSAGEDDAEPSADEAGPSVDAAESGAEEAAEAGAGAAAVAGAADPLAADDAQSDAAERVKAGTGEGVEGADVVLTESEAAEQAATEQAAMALITALMRLRGALASSKLPIDVVGADEARQQQKEMLDQLDDYILPRLVQLEAPVLAVVGGSTGAGKSTLVNSLIGQVVSEPGVLRPTTRSPVLIHNPVDAEWFTGDRVLPGMARSSGDKPGGTEDPGQIRLVAADTVPQGLAILDAPDIDSVVEANRELATQLLAAADLWLFVTTAARYADAVPWDFLQSASDRSTAVAVVLDRAPADTIDDITGHLAQMLLERGLGDSPLFSIKETVVDGNGMLPPEIVASIKDWLIDLAADAEARTAVVRRTLHGAVTAMTKKTPAFVTAVRAQADTIVELRSNAEAAYDRAVKDVAKATQDGTMLRGEVLARWQEFVGTGELLKGLQTNVGRVRDKVKAAVVGKPPPTRDLNDAVESGLESLLREHAEEAAERAEESWQSLAAGRQLLASGDRDMGRMSKEFPAAAAKAVRDWQGNVLDLVRKEGAEKRSTARILAYGVNGLGLALMIVIFASTAGITGAEVGVGAGTAVVGQKLLEAVFGDQAVRSLARKAREDLDGRVHALMDAEFARYLAVLDQHPVDPDAPRRLTEAARAVEDCT